MTKKHCSVFIALLLVLVLLAGCGKEQAPAESKAEEVSAQEETVSEGAAEAEPIPAAEEGGNASGDSAGPVELNQVIYDANGIRITAVSAEAHFDELEALREEDPVLALNLHIERTGPEKNTLSILRASTNGFRSSGMRAFLVGRDKSSLAPFTENPFMPFLRDADGTDAVFAVTKSHADYLGLNSIGEIGFVLEILKENGDFCYDSAKIDLGWPSEPACFVTMEEDGSFEECASIKVSNSSDSVAYFECLLKAYDAEGNPLYYFGYDRNTDKEILVDGSLGVFYVRNGAEDLPFGLETINLVDANGESVDSSDVGSVKVAYFAALPTTGEDLSGLVQYELEGWREDTSSMIFRCTWPEEHPRLRAMGTCYIYTEDGALFQIVPFDAELLCDDDYRDWDDAANPETGALDFIAVHCKDAAVDGQFRFELFFSYVMED